MSHATRKQQPTRLRLTPRVDHLESRALMTASAAAHPTFVHLLAEASKSIHVETSTHAPVKTAAGVVTHAAAHTAAHTALVVHHAAKHQSPAQVKAAQIKSARETFAAISDLTVTPVSKRLFFARGGPTGGYGPSQVAGAYGVTALGLANQGQGQTIGIIDATDDTSITSDTSKFSTYFGLPQFNTAGNPNLTVYKDTALGPIINSAGTGYAGETSLDVQWAHGIAPKANILLVEVPLASGFNDAALVQDFQYLLQGIQYAASHGASVVSLSYGYFETNSAALQSQGAPRFNLPALYSLNNTYINSSPTNSVALTVSSGDQSYPGFPGTSPNVIGVGGTSLFVTSSSGYGSETAWGGQGAGAGGGGPSAFFQAPGFQSSNKVLVGGRYRTIPDVSLIADPQTGVAIYDSVDYGGWVVIGGTSLASPVFAAELSIAQQQRVGASKAILNTAQIQNALYALYNSPNYLTYFHDITKGNNSDPSDYGYNGYSAVTGYDLASGIGSPIANRLIPYLASL